MRRLSIALLLATGLGTGGCQTPVTSVASPALAERALRRLAVLPLNLSPRLGEPGPNDPDPVLVADVIAHELAQALEERGFSVVPPEEARRVREGLGSVPSPPAEARRAAADFGVDAIFTGALYRVQKRSGEAAGSFRPAAVGFDVVLHGAPDGRELWRATFDEAQQALGENVLQTIRYPGGGTRWLTLEELARWGAREVARDLPAGP
jgi:hypothetical protein